MTDQTSAIPKATEQERCIMQTANMEYFKAPYTVTSGETEAELETQIEELRTTYLARRSKLENVSARLTKLRKTQGALQHQINDTQEAWRQDFVKGFGEQSKGVRDQLKQKSQWSSEATQTQEMIDLLEPQREWLRIQTHLARGPLEEAICSVAEISSHNRLMQSLLKVSQSEGIEALSAEVSKLFNRLREGTYNDHGYMAGLGIDVSLQPGSHIDPMMDSDSRRKVRHEIQLRQYAALGELVMSVMPVAQPVPTTEIERLPSLLACEAEPNEYASPIRLQRRLKELEAQMEYVPSQDDLDSA